MSVRVWWVQSKPFAAENMDSPAVMEFQKTCFEKRFFGMGWKEDDPACFAHYIGEEITEARAEFFRKSLRNSAFTIAQNRFLEMKVGDVVLTRLNELYYCGMIAERPRLSDHPLLTWVSSIAGDWTQIGSSEDLPHHVRGKLSGRDCHGTVAEIKGLSALTLMQIAGAECKVRRIGEDNFFYALGDDDLEDLMAHYMSKCHAGYLFLPSSCKKNTPLVEYVMYDPKSGKEITCQTKVNDEIDIDNYRGDNKEKYERIYLFSGVDRYLHADPLPANVTILSRRDLYLTLKENALLRAALNKYFVFA